LSCSLWCKIVHPYGYGTWRGRLLQPGIACGLLEIA
jgi:hypothetical protein